MKILLDGYADNNFGDDLMLTLAAKGLAEHELHTPYEEVNIENVQYTTARNGFDVYLKVTGSCFLIHNIKGIFYRMRDTKGKRICKEKGGNKLQHKSVCE